jgi:hypothetical protein
MRTKVAVMIATLVSGSPVSRCATGWPPLPTAQDCVLDARWRNPALSPLADDRGTTPRAALRACKPRQRVPRHAPSTVPWPGSPPEAVQTTPSAHDHRRRNYPHGLIQVRSIIGSLIPARRRKGAEGHVG